MQFKRPTKAVPLNSVEPKGRGTDELVLHSRKIRDGPQCFFRKINIGVALLIIGVSIPLVCHKIKINQGMLKQLIAVTPELSSDKSKNEIVAIVQKSSDFDPFEKEGALGIGRVGLQFNAKGKLMNVVPSWGPIK